MKEILEFLDSLEFGEYVIHENDCDVMAVKAREAVKERYPDIVTGIAIMYGISFPGKLIGRHGRVKWMIVGHGILAMDVKGGPYYYDCTTADGKDSKRLRSASWSGMWFTYLLHGYFVLFKRIEWGDYIPPKP